MRINSIKGWKDVYSFSFIQLFKSKAFIISNIIFLTIILISLPIVNLITSKKDDANEINSIKKVYINNETTLPNMDFSQILLNKTMGHIIFEPMKEEYDVVTKRIEEKENESIILSITENEEKYSFAFVKANKGDVKKKSLRTLSDEIIQQFKKHIISVLGIADEQLKIINSKVETKVNMADTNGEIIIEEDTSISFNEYWFVYGLLFIVLMINIFASTQIANSIVIEKSTRVVENLLISVEPLALMVGKIFAMLSAVLLQIISIILMTFISKRIASNISNNGESAFEIFPKNIFDNINFIHIVICLIVIILGVLFYATLAGLAGATISRMEEIGEGLTLFTITNLVGSYIGMGAAGVLMENGVNAYVIFSFICPLSTPFILPGAVLLGKVNALVIIGAIVLQIILVILLFLFVAKVYKTLILHNGNRIKLVELIKLSKTVTKGEVK